MCIVNVAIFLCGKNSPRLNPPQAVYDLNVFNFAPPGRGMIYYNTQFPLLLIKSSCNDKASSKSEPCADASPPRRGRGGFTCTIKNIALSNDICKVPNRITVRTRE